jgi:choline dehydrogenase-like flavoprotein
MHLTHLGPDGLAAYDVIIVGTSFAALPIAQVLTPRRRVLLIEGGDMVERDEMRALTASDEYGHFSDGHWASHWIRAMGGTSSRWSGVVAALEAADLRGGPGRPAWPISRADLDADYARAAEWLGRPAAVCTPASPFGESLMTCPLSHDTPVRLPAQVSAVTSGDNIDLLTSHTVIGLGSDNRQQVDGLVMTGPSRMPARVSLQARQIVVLACGAMGNVQILLQPPDRSDVAVGNESGLVGRFLMEHPHVVSGHLLVHRAGLPPMPAGFGPGLPAFRIAEPLMTRHDLLPCSLAVQGPVEPPSDGQPVKAHFEASFGLPLEWAALYARAEQEPSATNRVELLPERTWAGSHRLRMHCSFSSRDLRSIEVSTRLAGEALMAMRAGVVRLHNRAIYRETSGGGHTMGTTRMGVGRHDSVCDATQRVHGYDNLYLAGSSVFPTGGAANPTLTIAALSFRLGEHLRRRLAGA